MACILSIWSTVQYLYPCTNSSTNERAQEQVNQQRDSGEHC